MANEPYKVGQDLTGKIAAITGASQGIGKAIAISLAQNGAHIAIGSRSLDKLNHLKDSLGQIKTDIFCHTLDVASEASVDGFFQATNKHLGPIDILINNAGIYIGQPVQNHPLTSWQNVLDINLTSALLTSRHVVNHMIDNSWGRIINISSISGKVAEAYGAAYSASKFGLIGLTQSLALEVAKYGITVNAICPGWVETKMANDQLEDEHYLSLTEQIVGQAKEMAILSVPQMRFIEPEEVAALVVYLSSDNARGITGQAISICGGLSLH